MSGIVVAIDGPAGAGKSTVAKRVAAELGLRYLDTGAMYRCVALLAQRAGLGPNDGPAVAVLAERSEIAFGPKETVLLDGEDVTNLIRTPEMSEWASALSAFSEVRTILAGRQKDLIAAGGVVLEGRDTTSVVAPAADVKIFLTASLEERANRRQKELSERGQSLSFEELIRQIAERDHRDYTRQDSPLKKVDDAIVVETFGLTPEEVADRIVTIAHASSKDSG